MDDDEIYSGKISDRAMGNDATIQPSAKLEKFDVKPRDLWKDSIFEEYSNFLTSFFKKIILNLFTL